MHHWQKLAVHHCPQTVIDHWLKLAVTLIAKKRFQHEYWVASQVIQRINKGEVSIAALIAAAGLQLCPPRMNQGCQLL